MTFPPPSADDLRKAIIEQDTLSIASILAEKPELSAAELDVDFYNPGGELPTLPAFLFATWRKLPESMEALVPFCNPTRRHESVIFGLATPLMAVIETTSEEIIERLAPIMIPISDCNQRDADGCTALHLAILHCKSLGLVALLAQATDLEITDHDGQTPLELAWDESQRDIHAVLLAESERREIRSSCSPPKPARARSARL